jgi:hypothetical protein
MRFITPNIIETIPPALPYPYEVVNSYPTGNQFVATGATFSMSSNNIQLTNIPSKIYCYIRQQDSDLQITSGASNATPAPGYTYADGFARITGVSIQFNNVAGLLSSATEADLWRLSVRNGIELSWPEWTQCNANSTGVAPPQALTGVSTGAILCIKPYLDFGLPPDLAPGVLANQFNLQINVNAVNTNPNTPGTTFTLFIIIIQEGILTITSEDNALQQLGTLTKSEIVNARNIEPMPWNQAKSWNGGSFWSDLAETGNRVLSGIEKALPYAERAADIGARVAKVAGPLVPLLAAGEGGADIAPMRLRKQITKKAPRRGITYM